MAPVFSRPRPISLPDDVLRAIASLLPVSDLIRLVRVSKALHAAGAPVLYRSVETCIDPGDWVRDHVLNNRPIEVLLTIITSCFPHRFKSVPSRLYAAHIVTFSYVSWCLPMDFRAVPLLAEALRFTHKLRHLRVDVGVDALPLVLDVFSRSSIIITPSTTLAITSNADRFSLPCLQSIRSGRIAIVEALMSYRAIQTVAIDLCLEEDELAKFLYAGPVWKPAHLRQLSLSLACFSPSSVLLEGIVGAFPQLEHLALRVLSSCAIEYMEDALGMLSDLPACGRSLRTIGINHGGLFDKLVDGLRGLQTVIAEGCSHRPALREVVLGDCMWARENVFGEWSFVTSIGVSRWPWLLCKNEGEWGPKFGPATKSYQHRRFY
ncbi:hypothetical protein GSI_04566 [Ganoderma sinense ZZ0214-1]|uniref:F-box domain-containing protein n=1 Tax=Ganoderma sinense ZZ0214-1 TaxID=1077348 RepID=A0A2G8SHC9_9APHY|nr:hypothetical protein GSI_04566 [Ganoderma sinense ZZ0214-1]